MPVTLRGIEHVYRARPPRGVDLPALALGDLDVPDGELIALVGPSGCGKSTLLSLLAGFIAPTSGAIHVDGRPVTGPSHERGVVFRQPNLYPWLSVRDNVALGPRLRGVRRARRRAIAERWLDVVGLSDFAGRPPYELSGGMQQRCQIARVLANDPAIMLLDEPFGALDAITRERLQDELLRIRRGDRKTALFITHSVEEAVYLGTRVLVMSPRPGRIVFDARPPFSNDERVPELRTAPAFSAFRERVARSLADAHLELHA
ncbi:MAG TPA: ABC transporter ATP-binding protein [Solirubrobacteraceae bacterium]|nr:ABC transporter ATP-binding protein [Solirubrobacteraceae bacterium]